MGSTGTSSDTKAVAEQEEVLRISGLTKRFGRHVRVDDLSLSVGRGDVYGFLGPNGAGKSTTIRMALGLVRPTSGRVEVLGRRIPSPAALARVGAVIEDSAFYPHLSARKNLELFASLSGPVDARAVDRALDIVSLAHRRHDPLREYSHGMRQRCGIARALLPRPELLILDEPTTGLDPEGIRDMRRLVLRLRSELGITVFLSSHQLAEVEKICDRVCVIHLGRRLFEGTIGDLRRAQSLEAVRVETEGNPRQARDILERSGIASRMDGETAFLAQADRARVPDIARALVQGGVEVRSITPATATLEDLFLGLVTQRRDEP